MEKERKEITITEEDMKALVEGFKIGKLVDGEIINVALGVEN